MRSDRKQYESEPDASQRKNCLLCAAICLCMAGLAGRLFFLMLYKADYYSQMAEELHRRERSIKAPRGRILTGTER